MAVRKKAKRKTGAKRKKRRVLKPASRRKTVAVKKKRAKKAPARRRSPKRPTSPKKTAARRRAPPPAASVERPPARPAAAARPTPSPPAQQDRPGERLGVVTHYYNHLSVATLRLDSGTLRVGDVVHILGHTTDFEQRVESLEVDHSTVSEVGPGQEVGLKVIEHAREHDTVYKVPQ